MTEAMYVFMTDEQLSKDFELMEFECWYHSVVDDMANLICANGYDKVMFDVMLAVHRLEANK